MLRRALPLLALALALPASAHAQAVVDDDPAATSSAAGRFDVAARAADGTVVVRSLDVASGVWSPWSAVRGTVATSGPALAADDDGTLHLFTRAGEAGGIVESVLSAGTWSAWTDTPRGQFITGPGAGNRTGTTELDVLGLGLNGGLFHAYRPAPGAAFVGYGAVPNAFGTTAPGVVSRSAGRVDTFTRAQDGTVTATGFTPGVGWATSSLGGGIVGGVTAISRAPDQMDIYARGTGGAIFGKTYNGSAWSEFSQLPSTAGTSAPAAAVTGSGRVDMVVRDATTLYHASYTPAAGWSAFGAVGPIEAPVDRGVVNGTGGGDGAQLALALDRDKSPARHTYKLGRTIRVTGALRNAAGAPIAGATVGIAGTQLAAGSVPRALATVTTTPEGTFAFATKAGPGQRITAGYLAYTLDATAAATATATARTRAAATLKVSRRSVSRGQTVRFRGRLKGGAVPRRGKLVALQAKEGGRWRTFANPRSSRKGRFMARYRFTAAPSRPVGLRFRAVVPAEGSYPFTRGTSPTRRIVLRP